MSKAHMVVLGFVNRKPMYGYEIIQVILKKRLNIWINIKLPSIYKAIQVLEEKGYLNGEKQAEGNNPPRTVYTMTESGKTYYKKLLLAFIEESINHHHQFWFALSLIDDEITKQQYLDIVERKIMFLKGIIKSHTEAAEEGPVGFQDAVNPPFVFPHLVKLGGHGMRMEMEVLLELKKDIEENYDKYRGKK